MLLIELMLMFYVICDIYSSFSACDIDVWLFLHIRLFDT
jgi:hypothetical protein